MGKKTKFKFFSSNAIRGLLSLAGGVASLWPFLAPEVFSSIQTKFVYFFLVLLGGVLVAFIVAKSDEETEGDEL